jgi:hypothetical protein
LDIFEIRAFNLVSNKVITMYCLVLFSLLFGMIYKEKEKKKMPHADVGFMFVHELVSTYIRGGQVL